MVIQSFRLISTAKCSTIVHSFVHYYWQSTKYACIHPDCIRTLPAYLHLALHSEEHMRQLGHQILRSSQSSTMESAAVLVEDYTLHHLPDCLSAYDHLVEEWSSFRKIFRQFVLGHPDIILTLPNAKFVGPDYLRLEKELLQNQSRDNVCKMLRLVY